MAMSVCREVVLIAAPSRRPRWTSSLSPQIRAPCQVWQVIHPPSNGIVTGTDDAGSVANAAIHKIKANTACIDTHSLQPLVRAS
jgi:hypothetical protein